MQGALGAGPSAQRRSRDTKCGACLRSAARRRVRCAPHTFRSQTPPCALPAQRRAVAMERLARALAAPPDAAALGRQLAPIAAFLLRLVSDHNFKVAIGGLAALGDVAEIVGGGILSQIG